METRDGGTEVEEKEGEGQQGENRSLQCRALMKDFKNKNDVQWPFLHHSGCRPSPSLPLQLRLLNINAFVHTGGEGGNQSQRSLFLSTLMRRPEEK